MSTVKGNFPDYKSIINGEIRAYMPRVAKHLETKARYKLGMRNNGWPPLAASTLRKKARRKLISGRRLLFERVSYPPMVGIGHTPLVDSGRMGRSIHGFAKGMNAHLTIDFPMHVHEQDQEVAPFNDEANRHLPPRPLMGPTLEESIGPIITNIENIVARSL